MATAAAVLEHPLPWKVTSFRECRHSRNWRHLRQGATVATEDLARRYKKPRHHLPVLWLQATAVADVPPRCRWSCNASELQQEPLCCQAAAQSGVTGHHQVLSHFSTSRMGEGTGRRWWTGGWNKTNSQPRGDLWRYVVTRVYRCRECVVLLSQWHSCNFIFLANLYCMYWYDLYCFMQSIPTYFDFLLSCII